MRDSTRAKEGSEQCESTYDLQKAVLISTLQLMGILQCVLLTWLPPCLRDPRLCRAKPFSTSRGRKDWLQEQGWGCAELPRGPGLREGDREEELPTASSGRWDAESCGFPAPGCVSPARLQPPVPPCPPPGWPRCRPLRAPGPQLGSRAGLWRSVCWPGAALRACPSTSPTPPIH